MMTSVRRPTTGLMPYPGSSVTNDLVTVEITHVDGHHLRVTTPDGCLHAATFEDIRELKLKGQR